MPISVSFFKRDQITLDIVQKFLSLRNQWEEKGMTQLPEGAPREGSGGDESLCTEGAGELTKGPCPGPSLRLPKEGPKVFTSHLEGCRDPRGPHYMALGALGGEGSEARGLEPEKPQNHPA